jgi:hypothetical protein
MQVGGPVRLRRRPRDCQITGWLHDVRSRAISAAENVPSAQLFCSRDLKRKSRGRAAKRRRVKPMLGAVAPRAWPIQNSNL